VFSLLFYGKRSDGSHHESNMGGPYQTISEAEKVASSLKKGGTTAEFSKIEGYRIKSEDGKVVNEGRL
jgi:hypothetical protein